MKGRLLNKKDESNRYKRFVQLYMQGYYMTLYADISYYMTHKNNKTDMMMLIEVCEN